MVGIEHQMYLLCIGQELHLLEGVFDDLGKIKVLLAKLECLRFELGQVEEVVDQVVEHRG